MTPANDQSRAATPDGGDAYVRQQLASIDGSLFSGMPVDDRFESGVPEGQRGSSLDFIQMTGLTRPPLRQSGLGVEGTLAQTPIYDDLNASEPLSFYEKGVADVDDSVGRGLLDGGLRDIMLDVDLLPGRSFEAPAVPTGASPSVQAFRDIVANLQRAEAAPDPEAPIQDDDIVDTAQPSTETEEVAPAEYSTSGALLALVEELESVMETPPDTVDLEPEGSASEAPEAGADEPDSEWVADGERPTETPDSAPILPASDSEMTLLYAPAGVEAPTGEPAPSNAEAAPESTDEMDFDDLLAALAPEGAGTAADSGTPEIDVEPSPTETFSESWDELLDAMSVRGAEPATPREAAPEAPRVTAGRGPGSGALAEAEQLMQALEKRPRPATDPITPVPVSVETLMPAASAAEPTTPLAPTPPDSVPAIPVGAPAGLLDEAPLPGAETPINYEYAAPQNQRRSRRHSRIARRSRKIIKLVIGLALLGGAGAALWHYGIGPMLMKPADVSVQAARYMEEQKYESASGAYSALAQRYGSGDPLRADAEFNAAYALTLGVESNWDETSSRYNRALALFQKFVEDHPQHPKRARALSIMGRLHYELRDFDQAIAVLRDQVKTLDDPPAALARLRYLARAYSMKGSYGEAESTYLQSATMPGNYSAESDYLELGDLYGRRAEASKDPAERVRLKETATEYWRRALQVPGIAPTVRSTLEEKLKWLDFADQSTAEAPEAGADPTEVTQPVEAPVEGTTSPEPTGDDTPAHVIPVATDPAGRAEIPGAELEALAPPAPAEIEPPAAEAAPEAPEAAVDPGVETTPDNG